MVLEENVFLKELTLAKLRVDIIGIFFCGILVLSGSRNGIPGSQIPVILSQFKYFKYFLPANHTSAVDFVPSLS